MKISTEINSLSHLVGEEKAVEYIAKAGFDAWDFSMFSMCKFDWETKDLLENDHPLAGKDYLKFARKLKQIGLDNGIVCNQSHAPHPAYIPKIRTYFKRAIECTAEAGGKICVIHPDNFANPEENAEMYNELLPFAKDCGVKIATENMWDYDAEQKPCACACSMPDNFLAHLNAVNDDFFVACLDLGHAEMLTSSVDMIKTLSSHLQALHIHDNDKINDSHQIPFSMNIDFKSIVKALKSIDYQGYFTLEAYRYLNEYSKENAFEGVKRLAESARRLADMYDNL